MRIGVIADIHSNSVAFDRVINDINMQKVDGVIFLGDLVAKGPDPKGVLDRLKNLKLMVWIKGNSDAWFDEGLDGWQPKSEIEKYLYNCYNFVLECLSDKELESIKRLPIKQTLELDGYSILCVHGSPRSVDEEMSPRATDKEIKAILNGVKENVILSGHIHEPYIRKIFDKVIINPGSVGFYNKHGDSRASYAIIDFDDDIKVEFRKIEYNHQEAINIAKENGLPNIKMFEKFIITDA